MEYVINLTILFCIYSMLAMALNMVVGMSGLLSLAQAAFYGVGAYATALGMTALGWNFFPTILLGMFINAVLAYIVGKILARFQGDYYAIVSAGLSIIVFSVLLNWKSLTNGPLGVFGIDKPNIGSIQFYSNSSFLLLCFVFLAMIYGVYHLINQSSFGRALKAIREDEQLARVMGYNAKHFKSIIFVLSAALSGVAGSFFASYIAFIDPSTFQLKEGILLFTIIIVGGLDSIKGSILGAVVILSIPEALRFTKLPNEVAAQLQQMIYGAMLVLMMIFYPKGLLGKYRM